MKPPEKTKVRTEQKKLTSSRIIIVGAGLAGLSAAIEVAERCDRAAVEVLVIEKAVNDGSSGRASVGVCWPSEGSSESAFLEALVGASGSTRSGGNCGLLGILADLSRESVKWLDGAAAGERLFDASSALGPGAGGALHLLTVGPDAASGRARGVGSVLVKAARARAESLGVTFAVGEVTRLLQAPSPDLVHAGEILGVTVNSSDDVYADAVILATGGFGSDRGEGGLLRRFCSEEVARLPSTCGPGASGDGHRLAEAASAVLTGMQNVEVLSAFVDPADPAAAEKFLFPQTLVGLGASVTEAGVAVIPPGAADRYGRANLAYYASRGLLQATPDGGFTGLVTPAIHSTLGGVLIDSSARVLARTTAGSAKPIPRLFAAGEVAGGICDGTARLPGSALLEAVTFGRIAGERCAAIVTVGDSGARPALASSSSSSSSSSQAAQHFIPVRLASRFEVGRTAAATYERLVFALPSPLQSSGLGVGMYVNVRSPSDPATVRSYSPMSRADERGTVELLVKLDPAGGPMSRLLSSMRVGDTLEMSSGAGPDLYAVKVAHIGLIGGGVGIAPLISILRTVVANRTGQSVNLIYGAGTHQELLFYDLLLKNKAAPLSLTTVLERPPENWVDGRERFKGYITAEVIKASSMPPPGPGVKIVVCGPPPMNKAMKAILPTLGYTDDMVYYYF